MQRRNTPAKQEILLMLKDAHSALSQDMIEQQMKGTVDRVTIYRVLNSFCEDGVVHKIVSDEGKNYFALCTECKEGHHNHDHFHFRCLKCNKVECLQEHVIFKLPAGYKAQSVNCWISGVCDKCA